MEVEAKCSRCGKTCIKTRKSMCYCSKQCNWAAADERKKQRKGQSDRERKRAEDKERERQWRVRKETQCKTCYYSGQMPGIGISCDYILLAGHRRPKDAFDETGQCKCWKPDTADARKPTTDVWIRRSGKKVEQLDLNGNVIAVYSSVRSAAKATGANTGGISVACREPKKVYYGCRWRYVHDEKENDEWFTP